MKWRKIRPSWRKWGRKWGRSTPPGMTRVPCLGPRRRWPVRAQWWPNSDAAQPTPAACSLKSGDWRSVRCAGAVTSAEHAGTTTESQTAQRPNLVAWIVHTELVPPLISRHVAVPRPDAVPQARRRRHLRERVRPRTPHDPGGGSRCGDARLRGQRASSRDEARRSQGARLCRRQGHREDGRHEVRRSQLRSRRGLRAGGRDATPSGPAPPSTRTTCRPRRAALKTPSWTTSSRRSTSSWSTASSRTHARGRAA
mmetsp:Transcript_22057/g.54956  ORF Transcript_22057/g.54956 Transcript_22057/m.54956 type:complete len:254 (-) Transcript_22057:75-836(-)